MVEMDRKIELIQLLKDSEAWELVAQEVHESIERLEQAIAKATKLEEAGTAAIRLIQCKAFLQVPDVVKQKLEANKQLTQADELLQR